MSASFTWTPGNLVRNVEARVDTAMDRAGRRMVARAKALAPVRSAKLRDSIGYDYRPADRTLEVYAAVPYSLAVELGTSRRPARPFLRPALQEARDLFGR
jgi:HK97 gp10 family phage protein